MRKTRKILWVLVFALAVAAVMSVCAFAFDVYTDLPAGVTKEDDRWIPSGYADVDDGDGWYMMTSGTTDYSTTDTSFPTFATQSGTRFYWHKETNRAVWVSTSSSLSADSGEADVYSYKNSTSQALKRFYAYSACFVDITNDTNNTFKTHFATSSAEMSQYVSQSASKYPIYERYITAGTASGQWSYIYVTKDAYDDYVDYKADLGYAEDADVTDTTHQDLLVEWAYKKIATYKNLVNCKENGARYNLAWIFDQLAANGLPFERVDFRTSGQSAVTYRTIGLAVAYMEAETILFDKAYTGLNFTDTSRGLFRGNAALKTFTHVEFDATDTEDALNSAVTEGVVDLTGFTTISPYKTYYISHILQGSGMTKVVWFSSITNGETEYAGIIDASDFYEATSLEELVIPANVTLTQIRANAFFKCTSLKVIDVKGAVSSDFVIDNKNAFTNVSGLTIKVFSKLDKTYMEKALTAAGVEGVTVISKQEQSDLENAVVSEGFSVRMKDYTGLRALFSFDLDVEVANNANGYTLVSYGVFATSYKNFIEIYNGNEDILFAYAKTIEDNTGSAVKYVPVYNAGGTGANRYVDYATRTFCISLTNISSANALADIFMAGYAIWQDENGNEYYTITTYDMADGEKAVNLYEITLGLTKNGIINSENTEDVCFWQTLKVGALKTNEFSEIPETTATGYAVSADGYFEYLDVDWHAYTGATATDGYGFNPTGVDTQASGVVWSVLKYTDDEYVLVIRNKDKSTYTELSIPGYSAGHKSWYTNYSFYAPYDYRYGKAEKAGDTSFSQSLTAYNPTLTQNDYNKIKTMVVDHGITGTGVNSFAGLTSVETIVYPNGLSGKGEYKFIGSTAVRNVIWCHTDDAGNPVAHLSEFKEISDANQSLFDLRGMEELSYKALLRACRSAENVVFPTSFSQANTVEYLFTDTPALKRVWVDGDSVPDAGVVDLSKTNIQSLSKNAFDFKTGSIVHTVKLPSTVTTISGAKALGDGLSINFICNEAVAKVIIAYAESSNGSTANNISVNGTPIAQLKGN